MQVNGRRDTKPGAVPALRNVGTSKNRRNLARIQEEKFVVQSPTKLVVAYIDEDVVLPAFLSPSINAKGLEVRWYKDDYSSPVHLYKHQKTENVNQLHSFKGRTELFLEELKMGNVSLTLRGLRLTDNGTYKCLVASPELTDDTQIDVTILAIGTHPSISVNTEQNLLECKAEGWNPEPDVRWADGSGANLTSKANTELLKDQNGSPHVVSLIDINRKSNVFSCLMRSKTPKPNWESKLHIVNVTLNPDTAHSRLILTEDLKQVRLGDDLHKPNNPRHLPMCFNVLANEGFSSGSNYWEVVVGDKTRWSLGIVSEAINRDEKISVGPKKGIWLIWLKNENEYCALTDPPTSFSVPVSDASQTMAAQGAVKQCCSIIQRCTYGLKKEVFKNENVVAAVEKSPKNDDKESGEENIKRSMSKE
ncbi:ERMAP protein, partial [Polypterus senegalus]